MVSGKEIYFSVYYTLAKSGLRLFHIHLQVLYDSCFLFKINRSYFSNCVLIKSPVIPVKNHHANNND